jgi:PAS domain S-box-containing protein
MTAQGTREAQGGVRGGAGKQAGLSDDSVVLPSMESFKAVVGVVPLPIALVRADRGVFAHVNEAFAQESGYCPSELVGQTPTGAGLWVRAEDRAALLAKLQQEGSVRHHEAVMRTKKGDIRHSIIAARMVTIEGELYLLTIGYDNTEKRRRHEEGVELEKQEKEVRRLDSIAQFAGGVAHDFNNILMGVLGNAELASLRLPPESPAVPYVDEVTSASLRAAALARQMLACSGRGVFVMKPVSINDLVHKTCELMKPVIGPHISCELDLQDELPFVNGDGPQLQQLLVNLVTNAVEAMDPADAGRVTIKTQSDYCDAEYLRQSQFRVSPPVGCCVVIEVTDNGCGMDDQTKGRLFDPFFSTKKTGRGLGLTTVQGIVRGHQGTVVVETEAGKGSLFKVIFPARAQAVDRATLPDELCAEVEDCLRGKRLLVVDDDAVVRTVAREMLERAGCMVVVAGSGTEAIEIYGPASPHFDCVIVDLGMPGLDGVETVRELIRRRGELCVLLSSGFSEEQARDRLHEVPVQGFLQKPYKYRDLVGKLADVMAARPAPSPK